MCPAEGISEGAEYKQWHKGEKAVDILAVPFAFIPGRYTKRNRRSRRRWRRFGRYVQALSLGLTGEGFQYKLSLCQVGEVKGRDMTGIVP